ncbi:hypothetical protein [Pseudofrankia sp. BMG5.37]|uniref:hypothetical protein n=1 Tax=Pseudofrankia sp. BMG5.37 TaxID=3050035 RepID=UPI002893F8DF|nr:hypothetical protein [Pseudofrankia sp. BMG5.37]MDT3440145.1 hypothetical protein [Pseudofrankia sp. BMG5.37]
MPLLVRWCHRHRLVTVQRCLGPLTTPSAAVGLAGVAFGDSLTVQNTGWGLLLASLAHTDRNGTQPLPHHRLAYASASR